MLYPPMHVCDRQFCHKPSFLRHKDAPVKVYLFTMDRGVCEAWSSHLYCYCECLKQLCLFLVSMSHEFSLACNTNYHHEYAVHAGERYYYQGLPDAVQVAEHTFVERAVLQHFLTLTLLSWTSATNAAHIYHQSLAQLSPEQQSNPSYQLRTEHVWNGFVINALLKDAARRQYVLQVPHTGDQKDRFTAAMRARNEHIRRSGQPEFTHYCTKCVRRFDHIDGHAGMCFGMLTMGLC